MNTKFEDYATYSIIGSLITIGIVLPFIFIVVIPAIQSLNL